MRQLVDKDLDDYWELYVQYIDEMEDCLEHKIYMLSSDKCFAEWVSERKEKYMPKKKQAKKIAKKRAAKSKK